MSLRAPSPYCSIAVSGTCLLLWLLYDTSSRRHTYEGAPRPRVHEASTPAGAEVAAPTCRDMSVASAGSWRHNATYEPARCRLPALSARRLGECLLRRGISHIGVLGDSQGARYEKALREVAFSGGGWRCNTTRQERYASYSPERTFYSGRGADARPGVLVHDRDCSGCVSSTARCSQVAGSSPGVTIDYYVMEYVMDTEVTLVNQKKGITPDIIKNDAFTSQEMIFKNIWGFDKSESNGSVTIHHPDIILLFGTFVHDIARRDEREFRRDVSWQLDLISYYLNFTRGGTRLFYFNTPRVLESKIPDVWKAVTKNSGIRKLNDIWRQEYDKRLSVANGGAEIFRDTLDLFAMSDNVPTHWYRDAVHLSSSWYNTVLYTFLSMLCTN